ncbi:hypothetical protein MAR_038486 [Mya arenaria]|uniref:Uncharacterized protein n=1 Tax=Mya arenaria TaxID=6604 RepID=A0ABY7FRN0_MYAAR|nr:hypothetical protein MAR_038486 [Mya arenaria]
MPGWMSGWISRSMAGMGWDGSLEGLIDVWMDGLVGWGEMRSGWIDRCQPTNERSNERMNGLLNKLMDHDLGTSTLQAK